MKNFIKYLLLIISINFNLLSQNISPYSRFGIGEISPSFSTSFGLYNAPNVSSIRQDFINLQNPAANSKTRYTIFNIGSIFTKSNLADNFSKVDNLDDGAFNNVAIAIPIDIPNGFTITSGILPFSKVNDEIKQIRKINSFKVEEIFSATGGLTDLFLGASYSPLKNLYIGLTTDYIFGERSFNHKSEFIDTTFQSNKTLTKHSENAVGANFSFIYEKLNEKFNLSMFENLTIGSTLKLPSKLNSKKTTYVERDYLHEDNYLTQFYDTLISSTTNSIPAKFTIGTSVTFNQKLFSAEYSIQNWKNVFTNATPNVNFLADENYTFALTNIPTESQTFKDNITYSLGFAHRKTYLELNGNQILENYFSAGIGFPLSYTGRMQLGLSYLKRGTKANNLIDENIFGAFINLTIGELWFVQPIID